MSGGIDKVRQIMGNPESVELPQDMAGGKNVRPLRDVPEQLKPRARFLLAATTWAGDLRPVLDRAYVIKGWLDQGALSVLFGPSNAGKSFLALDMAHHVAKGRDWGGRRVRRGRVLYVAAEGGGTFANRVAALDDPEFFVLTAPVVLTGRDNAAPALAEVIQHLAATGGARFDLVVIDTMARVMGGADENLAPDIASLVSNLEMIRRMTGAHVMLVHHSGKDTSKGARGHSSLRAAVDTEIELTRDDFGQITAEVTKQRDGPTGYRFSYTLRQVELGRDQDGDLVTSCLVEPMEPVRAGHAAVSGSARIALDLLEKALQAEGEILRRPEYPGRPCVAIEKWREACISDGRLSSSDNRETLLRTFRRCREELEKAAEILVRDDIVWRKV